MSEEIKTNTNHDSADAVKVSNRRRLLKLGVASVPAIVSMQAGSALANAGLSISVCEVVITPEQVIEIENLPPTTMVPEQRFNSDRLMMLYDDAIPVTNDDASYIAYLNNLAASDPGFSCLNSIQAAFVR